MKNLTQIIHNIENLQFNVSDDEIINQWIDVFKTVFPEMNTNVDSINMKFINACTKATIAFRNNLKKDKND